MKTPAAAMSMAQTDLDNVRSERDAAWICCVTMFGLLVAAMIFCVHMLSELKADRSRPSDCLCMRAMEVRINGKR